MCVYFSDCDLFCVFTFQTVISSALNPHKYLLRKRKVPPPHKRMYNNKICVTFYGLTMVQSCRVHPNVSTIKAILRHQI